MCHSHGSQGESAQKNENDKHKDGVKVEQMMDLHDFTAVLPVCIFYQQVSSLALSSVHGIADRQAEQ